MGLIESPVVSDRSEQKEKKLKSQKSKGKTTTQSAKLFPFDLWF
jgi:hypothetical protein